MAERLTKKYLDILSALPYGVNSGVAALLLPREQAAFGVNVTFRGGYATDRAPVQKLSLNFGGDVALEAAVRHGFFQGAAPNGYRPDFGPSQNIAQISGRLFSFTENGAVWDVKEITIPGDPNDATTNQVWMWQAEKWLIISDGTSKLPIFYDGMSCRRSYGPSVVLGTVNAAIPAGTNAIGDTITATMAAVYSGPYDIPVFFNGGLYQTLGGSIVANNTQLINLSDTPGDIVPSGSDVLAIPDRIGIIRSSVSAPSASIDVTVAVGSNTVTVGEFVTIQANLPGAATSFFVTAILVTGPVSTFRLHKFFADPGANPISAPGPNVHWLLARLPGGAPTVNVGVTDAPFTIPPDGPPPSTTATIGATATDTADCSGFFNYYREYNNLAVSSTTGFYIGATVTLGSFTGPNVGWKVSGVGVGTISLVSINQFFGCQTANTIPAGATITVLSGSTGGTVQVRLTSSYTGPVDVSVWIGDEIFTIAALPEIPSTTLYLINLSDTTAIPVAGPPGFPQDITSVPEIPACRMGAYGLGQNWFSAVDGLSFGVSDLVGSSSGTQANNYRDAVLKTTDLTVMGYFRLPNSGEIITSMTFVATLDQALGQGPLQIGVPSGMFSVKAPFTLIDFQGTTLTEAISNPILTKSLIGFGPVAQNSTVLANSDTIFRSFEGVNSLILARRDFSDLGGNTPISREMTRVIQNDTQSLLSYSSAIVFDNRLRMTCAPNVSAQGVFHMGELVLNYDLLSSLRGKAQPVWDGLWTGLNILQYMQGMFGPVSRAFAFSFNITDTQIELYELLPTGTEHFDNGDTRIKWVLETPLVFGPTVKTLTEMCRLIDGEMYLSDVNGRVDVVVLYRPLFYPCWRPWHNFSICADMDADNAQEQVRYALGFGEPDAKDCDSINNQSFRDALAFQLRFEFTGHCRLWGVKCLAEEQPNPKFTKPAGCTPLCLDVEVEPDIPVVPPAATIGNEVVYFVNTCPDGWDLTYTGTLPGWITLDAGNSRLVGLAGVYFATTQAEANALAQAAINAFGNAALGDGSLVCVDPEAFSNVEVYFVHDCGADTLTYDGTLPAWITLDDVNSQLVGAAGTYFGATQVAANAAAQAALDAFGTAALGDASLSCVAPNVCDAGFTDRFRLAGYVDGSLAICPFQDTSADPVWAGKFETHQVISPTQCRFYNGSSVSVDGAPANAFSLALDNFTAGKWRLTLSTFSFGNHDVFWTGTLTSSSPIGVYTWTSGCDVTPTLTVEQYTPP